MIITGSHAQALFGGWELVHAVSPELTLYGIARWRSEPSHQAGDVTAHRSPKEGPCKFRALSIRARIVLCVLVATVGNAVATLPTTAPVATVPFHSVEYGYSVSVPTDWVQVPADEVRARSAKLAAQSTIATKTVLDAAFQPTFLRLWFAYPHVSVTVIPYTNVGLTAPSSDADFDALAHRLFSAEAASRFTARHGAGSGVGHVDFDRAASRVTARSRVQNSRLGPIRITTVSEFGRDAIVELSSTVNEDDWDQFGPIIQRMTDSFHFDRDQELPHAPAPTRPSDPKSDGDFRTGIAVGFAIGVALGVTLILLAVRRRRANHYDW